MVKLGEEILGVLHEEQSTGSREMWYVDMGRRGDVWSCLGYSRLTVYFVSEEHRGRKSTVLYFSPWKLGERRTGKI